MKNIQSLDNSSKEDQDNSGLSLKQMIGSVMASFLGVQSSEKRKRDFQRGNAKQFIIVGAGMTLVWYGAIYLVVSIILSFLA